MSVGFVTNPQQAYEIAGSPRGMLRTVGEGACKCCRSDLVAYSAAGADECRISGFCEPCFDFVALPTDERDAIDAAWMRRVTRKEGAR